MNKKKTQELREEELISEIKSILRITSHWMAIPLFLLFWIADIFLYNEFKWQFLTIRLLIIPLCLVVNYIIKRVDTLANAQILSLIYAVGLATGINTMIYMIGDISSSYYAGLNLIAIGCLSFIPFTKRYYFLATLGIYAPYYLINFVYFKNNPVLIAQFVTNSFFIISSICMCFLIRFFHEELRIKELAARLDLKEEVLSREKIIKLKTEEAVKLDALGRQFSPQVIKLIKDSGGDIESKSFRSEVAVIFIDIVNSTERVNRIDKDKFEKVITKFLDDAIKILLKYDITIDKFLGDGILAFSNAPIKRDDYIERTILAALEVKKSIVEDSNFYELHWQKEFQIRIGIAKGFANIGFYGSKKYFKNFTAIGPVTNLSARLCSEAMPMQILCDYDVHSVVDKTFKTNFLGKKTLKGFEGEIFHTYEIIDDNISNTNLFGITECPICNSMMSLEKNPNGHYIFKCKECEKDNKNAA